MLKDLTCTGAKRISITFRVSQFQEIACDKYSHPAREVKVNLKTRFAILLKKEKNTPVELEPTTFELEVQHANPLRHVGFSFCKQGNFCVHYLYFWTTLVQHSVLFFSPFNFIHQKAWFEMFSRFIRRQTYRIFSFLYISHTIHRNFRNWHQLFYKRSSSCKIRALPLSNVFWYTVSMAISITLKITFNQT